MAASVIQIDETHEFASTAQAPALARDAIAKFAQENGVEEARVDIARCSGPSSSPMPSSTSTSRPGP